MLVVSDGGMQLSIPLDGVVVGAPAGVSCGVVVGTPNGVVLGIP